MKRFRGGRGLFDLLTGIRAGAWSGEGFGISWGFMLAVVFGAFAVFGRSLAVGFHAGLLLSEPSRVRF
jgi:hypothetical protein